MAPQLLCISLTKNKKENKINSDEENIVNNKQFWRTIYTLLSKKLSQAKTCFLVEGDEIISKNDRNLTNLNYFFFQKHQSIMGLNPC